MNIFFEWEDPAYDADYLAAITETATRIRNLVVKEQGLLYENSQRHNSYAVYDTPLTTIYGENLPLLRKLKKKYDPKGVMNFAGGWKFWSSRTLVLLVFGTPVRRGKYPSFRLFIHFPCFGLSHLLFMYPRCTDESGTLLEVYVLYRGLWLYV